MVTLSIWGMWRRSSRRGGFNSINRRDLQRLATITAEVDSEITTPNKVIAQVKAEFTALPEGYKLIFLGEKKKAEESIAGMKRALVIALAVIFFILAALFKSLLDPLVVMFAIPFGFIGCGGGASTVRLPSTVSLR